MKNDYLERFQNLNFEKFKELASDNTLNMYEKIGFPTTYRQGKEKSIFLDIVGKLKNLEKQTQTILDIGPGCSELPLMLIELCEQHSHELILIDSEEMLSKLPDKPFIKKIAMRYPDSRSDFFEQYKDKIDIILTYSVFHYIFADANIFEFIDKSLSLLAEAGEFLIGDIPNVSKRKRFFSSNNGIKFHQAFTQTTSKPDAAFNTIESGQIDDAVMMSVIQRCRSFGFDAYVLPQNANLPMANRREDILITRP